MTTTTDKIIACVKANPGITANEVFGKVDDICRLNDASSFLSDMYRRGVLRRDEFITDKKRKSFRYFVAEEKKVPSRIDIIGQNGNDGQHYDEIDASLGDTEQEEMPPADPVLLAKANAMLHEKLGTAEGMLSRANEAMQKVTDQRDAWRSMADVFGCETPDNLFEYIKRLEFETSAQPLFYMAYSNGQTPSVVSNSLEEARRDCENLALQDGIAFVCSVVAQCEATVQWKEAA